MKDEEKEYTYNRKNADAYETRYIGRFEQDYPLRLQNIPNPPAGIYVRGKLPEENRLTVGIVGSRNCSCYGRWIAKEFAYALAKAGVQIISGLARGIDGISQEAVIEAGGSTFGVLGCGVEVVYPRENKKIYEKILEKGGLISEVLPDAPPIPSQFPSRNRIISGLSDVLLVVEAGKRSGTGITVSRALEQGKDVYAVPGRIGDTLSEGCNRLIAQGAGIALSPDELLKELGIGSESTALSNGEKNKKINLLEKREKMVYSTLDFYPTSLEEIALSTKLPIPEILESLLTLQIKGLVRESGKNNYMKLQ